MSSLTSRRSHLDPLLLWIRVATSALLFVGHGVGKYHVLQGDTASFPDPLGLGPTLSLLSSMAVECLASVLVAVGLLTRLACLSILFTMATVAIIVHRHDSWALTEPSVLFFLLFSVILSLGPGRYSLDALRARKLPGGA